jgi:steroid delta-isomerase-like uncharacterized protein
MEAGQVLAQVICNTDGGGSMTSTEENKAIVRRFYDEFFNKGNLQIVNELHTSDYQHHDPNAPDPGGGAEGYIRRNAVFLKAFPDRQLTIEDQLGEGDKVATRITMRANHAGDLPGIPATGKRVTIESMHICRISDGRIAEEWELFDALGMMRQLGASPSQGLNGS